ncbi:MAG: hypothetical protein NTZ53_03435 [Cyanobacteria bacterium]|nr:hypothetical protein [Cyanobacteriota bacterium]
MFDLKAGVVADSRVDIKEIDQAGLISQSLVQQSQHNGAFVTPQPLARSPQHRLNTVGAVDWITSVCLVPVGSDIAERLSWCLELVALGKAG